MTTRDRIIDAGVNLARNGLHKVNSRSVGEVIGLAHSNVLYYFVTVDRLRDAIARAAIERGDSAVIVRMILDKHPLVAQWPYEKRQAYLSRASL